MKTRKYRLIINNKAGIKSRQWWLNSLKRILAVIEKYLPTGKKHITKYYEFSLVITNNKEIRLLNNLYRKVNKPTDVLSFPLKKTNQAKDKYLGDIIISTTVALENAKKNNLDLETEIQMLIIHGYLHLIGFDHKKKKDAKVMFSLQNKILTETAFH